MITQVAADLAADEVLAALLLAQAQWLATRDRSALRGQLLAILVGLQ